MYAINDLISNPDLGIAALNALKKECKKSQKLEESVAAKTQQISEMILKVSKGRNHVICSNSVVDVRIWQFTLEVTYLIVPHVVRSRII